MTLLHSIPIWGYFVLLGLAFLTAHLVAYRPSPELTRRRRTLTRWGSSLLFLAGLLLVSNERVGTIIPALLLAALGGVVSGRTAPARPPT